MKLPRWLITIVLTLMALVIVSVVGWWWAFRLNAGPVLYLRFDEGSGTVAADSSINRLDGILKDMNGDDWVAGLSGKALNFDGRNKFVLVRDSPLLDFGTEDFSVSYWAIKRSITRSHDNIYGVSKWGSGAKPGTNEWLLNIGSLSNTDRPSFCVEVGTTFYRARSPSNIKLNAWHHIVGTRQDSTLRIYVDGALEGIDSSMPKGSVINNTGRDLAVATNTSPSIKLYRTDAIIDEVQIYDFALSDGDVALGEKAGGEIATLFNNAGAAIRGHARRRGKESGEANVPLDTRP